MSRSSDTEPDGPGPTGKMWLTTPPARALRALFGESLEQPES
ncbi:hypothetical protein [Mycolicibacter heraklionensis]|nr:hypothetical protein [Mycolicibacter heraklionensis]